MTRAKDISKILTDADISGNIDVDGVTNLDVVDIDGAVDMASTLQVDGAITSSDGMIITTADNTAQLILKSTDADSGSGPRFELTRDSGSPANADNIGLIVWKADDAGGTSTEVIQMLGVVEDVTDGSEYGSLDIRTMVAGNTTSRAFYDITETVFNDGSKDLDFRVESDNDANAFFVEGSTGNVGIGTSSPTGKLDISSGTTYQPHLRISNTSGGGRIFGINVGVASVSNGYFSLRDETGSANRMVITDSGYILIGNITALPSSSVSGFSFSPSITSVNAHLSSAGSSTSSVAHINFLNGNGAVGNIVTSGGGTSFGTSSDYRLKENVNYSFDATTRLKQLKPARFNFIADADTTVDGFLAHEVSSVVPEAIIGEKDAVDDDGNPVMQSIDQSKIVPLLVKTIQELEARITALESA